MQMSETMMVLLLMQYAARKAQSERRCAVWPRADTMTQQLRDLTFLTCQECQDCDI